MSTKDTNARDYLKNMAREPIKLFRVYDVSNRVWIQYECVTHTLPGEACLKTEYVYDGTSTRVLKLKESLSTWDISFEV